MIKVNHSKFYVLPLIKPRLLHLNQVENTWLFKDKVEEQITKIELVIKLKKETNLFIIVCEDFVIVETVNLLLKGKYSKINDKHKRIILDEVACRLLEDDGTMRKHPVHIALDPTEKDIEEIANNLNVDPSCILECGKLWDLNEELYVTK